MTIQGQAARTHAETSLPIEIGFLAAQGVAPETLQRASRIALATGVPADVAILKTGLIEERAFYRALARELGLPFLDGDIDAGAQARFPEHILMGAAPLGPNPANARFALAPSGERLAHLLLQGRPLQSGLAVTPPSALTSAVFKARAAAIAWRAANELPQAEPDHSYRNGFTAGQVAVVAVLTGLAVFLATLGPAAALSIAMTLSSVMLLSMIAFRIAAALEPATIAPARSTERLPDRDLPVYTVIVPLYRERRALKRLIAAVSALDYPAAKLDVKLVIEADDRETAQALARLNLPGFVQILVAPAGLPKTKPRALNVALPLAQGAYTVVYDAEDVPDPHQLRLAVAAFARVPPDVACLQARLVIDNTDDSMLTRFFTVEYAALFDVMNPALATFDMPVPLGGTSNHFRTGILRGLHGWDAWNVTEDADLGIRLALAGYRVADLPSATLEEAPATVRAWLKQRTRWMKGYMQTCITHGRRPAQALRALGFPRFMGAVTMTFGALLAALGYPFFVVHAIVSFANGTLMRAGTPFEALQAAVGLTLFVAGLFAMMAPAAVAIRHRRLRRCLAYVPLLPLYYVLVSIAAWRGLAELLLDPFRWNKTEHGLARTSRAGLLTDVRSTPARPAQAAGRG